MPTSPQKANDEHRRGEQPDFNAKEIAAAERALAKVAESRKAVKPLHKVKSKNES